MISAEDALEKVEARIDAVRPAVEGESKDLLDTREMMAGIDVDVMELIEVILEPALPNLINAAEEANAAVGNPVAGVNMIVFMLWLHGHTMGYYQGKEDAKS